MPDIRINGFLPLLGPGARVILAKAFYEIPIVDDDGYL